MTRKIEIVATNIGGVLRKYQLPLGIRVVDCKRTLADDEAQDVIDILFIEGAKSRFYFASRGLLDAVKRLKARSIVEPIPRGSNYHYALTSFGYFGRENHFL